MNDGTTRGFQPLKEPRAGGFHAFVEGVKASGGLVVQPRLGFSDPARMREALVRIRDLPFATVGTLTLDSFTRTGQLQEVREALVRGESLNGYPLTSFSQAENIALLAGIHDEGFPIQVRHGCPKPEAIFTASIAAGVEAGEGGPVSYCLPYSRIPLAESLSAWRICCERFATEIPAGRAHLESFGGCMLGQLCPPVMLLTIGLLEALFFQKYGIRSISLSYSQGYHMAQDLGAVIALNHLAGKYLGDLSLHVVVYTFMGLFPVTRAGARRAVEESARLALAGGGGRLIVKTAAEAHRIPTVEDNLEALTWASEAAAGMAPVPDEALAYKEQIVRDVSYLLERILNAAPDLDQAVLRAFGEGWLDIPYCLHPENPGRAKSWIGEDGQLIWVDTGSVPLPNRTRTGAFAEPIRMTASAFRNILAFNQRRFDQPSAN